MGLSRSRFGGRSTQQAASVPILFTVEGEKVYVLRIRHSRRRHLEEPH